MGHYGYSQIGKACTIYPENNEQLLFILSFLYKKTKKFESISLPSDFTYMFSNLIFYRYGEILVESKIEEGEENLQVDLGDRTIPDNIKAPISDYYIPQLEKLNNEYRPIKSLRVIEESSVYSSIDVENKRICVIKMGNFLIAVNILCEDGLDRVLMNTLC